MVTHKPSSNRFPNTIRNISGLTVLCFYLPGHCALESHLFKFQVPYVSKYHTRNAIKDRVPQKPYPIGRHIPIQPIYGLTPHPGHYRRDHHKPHGNYFYRESLRADLSILSALSLHCVTKTAQAGGFFKNGRFMLDTFEPSVDVVFTQL